MFWGLYVYIVYHVAMVDTIHWLRAEKRFGNTAQNNIIDLTSYIVLSAL